MCGERTDARPGLAGVYSTGRANLPGAVTERQLLASWSRMLPELLRYSSASGVLESIPESLQAHHRVKGVDGVLVSCEEEPMVPIGRHTRNCDTIHAAFEEDTEGVDLSAFGF